MYKYLKVRENSKLSFETALWWNPVNMVNNGPKKFGHNKELTILMRISLQENVWSFFFSSQKKVAVITR